MGVVYLVRHGQASFGEADYDALSERGLEQARVLGAALRARAPEVHLVVTGTLRRHKQTAAGCLAELGEAAKAAPTREIQGLDELDHDELLACLDGRYANRGQLIADVVATGAPHRAFQAIFTRAVARWTSGAHDADYSEPWSAFRHRCCTALEEVAASLGSSQTALVFTSGGPITAACQERLSIPDGDVCRLLETLVNCGVTKVLHGARGLVLSSVNEHAHFEGARRHLITYR